MISGRSLHYVLKIGDRGKNAFFFRDVLGMKVLRHEEFKEGCDAQCNGPYDNRWSKTMIGYGPESSHFVIELTYNYGVKSYEMGNDFQGITIKCKNVIERIKTNNYPFTIENDIVHIYSPDGYKFHIIDCDQTGDKDPVIRTSLSSTDLEKSIKFWNGILNMTIKEQNKSNAILCYGDNSVELELIKLNEKINRAKAYGRIAFAVPYDTQPEIDRIIKENNQTILTPLISLDTPGKATVRVIILADPDGHEICFVDEEGFSQLSIVDPGSNADLDKYIDKDPFQGN